MAAPAAPRPTDGELELLTVLWAEGPCTVARAHEMVSSKRGTGYTTVLKLLQIMLEKGLVKRDDSRRQHVYRAAVPPAPTRRRLVRDLIDRAFSGSSHELVMHALSSRKASRTELAEIRRMIEQLDKEAK